MALGPKESMAKFSLNALKRHLNEDAPLTEDVKAELVRICDDLLNGKDFYDKREKGRKAEANFERQKWSYFKAYILRQAKISKPRIHELTGLDEKTITRVNSYVEKRLASYPQKHWKQYSTGHLEQAFYKLMNDRKLSVEEKAKIQARLTEVKKNNKYIGFNISMTVNNADEVGQVNKN